MPLPLDPDGLVWQHFGRLPAHRLSNGLREAMLQNMHPELAAGVELQSTFFEDPLARGRRSIGPIMSVVYGGANAPEWGKLIRGFHGPIKGVDRYGRPYSALNPDTFFWAHATFVEDIVTGRELTGFPLSEAVKQALYLESVDWYRLYGVSMKPVPPDWDAFQQYWEHMVTNVLEDTRPVREGFRMYRTAPAPTSARLSARVNAVIGPYLLKPFVQTPLMKLMLWLTVGALGPVLRDRLCLDWTTSDELRYRAHLKVVHQLIRAVPDERQYLPLAREARDHYRATGEVAAIPVPVLDHANTGPLNLENPSQPSADIANRSGAPR
ncbi:MAG TPA: oxygenase MpaB family protein [Mycobacteriales bacterium]|nr:oxygenase MpaB family protein [Mycobacteriales bacterium]